MSAVVRSRLPMPMRLDDESWAVSSPDASARDSAPPSSAPAQPPSEDPPQGFVDRLVAAARELDAGAFATLYPADYSSPMERRVRARCQAIADASALVRTVPPRSTRGE